MKKFYGQFYIKIVKVENFRAILVNKKWSKNFVLCKKFDRRISTKLEIEVNNVMNLKELDKILLPPLHIKLGLITPFVKALPPDCNAFM